MPADTAAARHLAACHLCLKLADASLHHCPRCGEPLHQRKPNSLQRTLALLVTASVLYIPANMLPIMVTDQFGNPTDSTILGGVVLLIQMDSIPIAVVIFIASVMVPLGKLLALFYLCWSVAGAKQSDPRQRTVMYRAAEFIGKWSMVDVFVVSILVALVHLTGLLVILPGAAAVAFAGVVLVTMVAAESFDPRMIWDQQEEIHE
jgi:paraquat-inducible protein A